ncbi:Transcription repressor of multidrug efflux pump acrAB operon, TetR (AcrR) family [Citrobacter freundii]|uniref:Transcription repressor of multidrug efflux pump acrAB operon, TetR (AcrR) family n=1 Tax=Citrobacter freundii TaxID=546 RepID=A0A7G2IMU9_CITFR|nr:Transcription repressor of multidrug efflux pump acrAB operon, TetR (AcrR) family [Citrobacter freundii]
MISEQAIREKIGINHLGMRIALQKCMDDGLIATSLDLDVIIIILHGSFSGIVKNWLINPMSYDLYKQAPVLVDNVLKMLSPDGSVRQLAQSESQVGGVLAASLTAAEVGLVALFEVDAVDQLKGIH